MADNKLTANDLINLRSSLASKNGNNRSWDYSKIFANAKVLNKIMLKNNLSDNDLEYLSKKGVQNFIAIPTKSESSSDDKLTQIKNKFRIGLRYTFKTYIKKGLTAETKFLESLI